jgi:TfoX/Sxy family transcriptional regulator of competence genes
MFSPICGRTKTITGCGVSLGMCHSCQNPHALTARAKGKQPALFSSAPKSSTLKNQGIPSGGGHMAVDEGLVEILRDDLAQEVNITEKRMFGGLCFMLNGNMLCGVHKNGGMFRVGKAHEADALSISGARPMGFTGRPMAGFIDVEDELLGDDTRRLQMLALAKDYVGAMPPK